MIFAVRLARNFVVRVVLVHIPPAVAFLPAFVRPPLFATTTAVASAAGMGVALVVDLFLFGARPVPLGVAPIAGHVNSPFVGLKLLNK